MRQALEDTMRHSSSEAVIMRPWGHVTLRWRDSWAPQTAVTVMGLGVSCVLYITAQGRMLPKSAKSFLLNQLPPSSLYPVCQQWPCNCIQSPSQCAFWRPLHIWCQMWLRLSLSLSLWPPFLISSSSLLNVLWHCVLWQDFMPFLLLSIIIFFYCQSLGQQKRDSGSTCSSCFFCISHSRSNSLKKKYTHYLFWDASEILILQFELKGKLTLSGKLCYVYYD